MPTSRGWYWALFAAIIAVTVAYAERRDLASLYHKYVNTRQEVEALESQAAVLEQEAAKVKEQVNRLDDDPLEVEAAIRRGKSLVREGETVFRVEVPKASPE